VDWELTGVPYTSAERDGGIARAIHVLRDGGLAERLAALGAEDAGDLQLLPPTGVRGDSGLLNEEALVTLVEETAARVGATHERGRRPLLVGGDCPVLLGALAAIGKDAGLVMLDGHEDAWPPLKSETGEASDSEVAIALGRVDRLPGWLADLVPLIAESALAYLGPRDAAEIAAAGVATLRGEVAFFAGDGEIVHAPEPEPIAAEALEAIAADALWVHVDLDVLDSELFEAVDYPQRGGLDWETLDRLTAAAIADPRCRGVSVVIYNPDLDPTGRRAGDVIDFACRLVRA
jgi:arginase